ncbi:hypothetical protein [uncultured Flavonifractor sp.]|uniref:hypothetical protein n=1 Tax=uncultured Flavonifractor sp. TaxID=1193534 RepID=UPI00259258DB|nr:hypothetical protein [uncultured Flavonifractor sp.]
MGNKEFIKEFMERIKAHSADLLAGEDTPADAIVTSLESVKDLVLDTAELLGLKGMFQVEEEREGKTTRYRICPVAGNTCIDYLYRDASNYKKPNRAIIRGRLSEEEQQAILDCLSEGEYFIPSQVGLHEERFDDWTEDDHAWFELAPGFAEPCFEDPDVDLDGSQLVERFQAMKGKWNENIAW